jgi:hypothetical protein
VYTSEHKQHQRKGNKMTTKSEALKYLTSNSSNTHWNVACFCKACTGKPFKKITVEDMAERMVASGLDFHKNASLGKLSHTIIQGA